MDSRREFIRKAALLSGAAGIFSGLPASVQKAFAIDPAAGSTYLDAEHIVVLMQENRSFDHCYGTLKGVRGFKDPRAVTLPDGDPVWFQKNASGEAYAPFRLNIKETKSTWTGSLPHSWPNQVDARNNGKYDKWLIAKPSGNQEFAKAPLTMGYYNRTDIPFYYALADAFTVCDQNFSSSLTGTTPNRLYLWTGTVRDEQNENSYANVRNENVSYSEEANWTTFPERLEDLGVSWKIYQNELSLASGLTSEEDQWLSNFTDNPIEWFSQYQVRFSATHRRYMRSVAAGFPVQIEQLEQTVAKLASGTMGGGEQIAKQLAAAKRELINKKRLLEAAKIVNEKYTDEAFVQLTEKQQSLHSKAFTTNTGDPDYRSIETYTYEDGDTQRTMNLPKGDILHQFRQDVTNGSLPTVSWIVGPENFSDHPGAPWYGAWLVSEVMDILTKKPEVWRKTIFILCYDENDGYFDHVPPFVPPDPYVRGAGKVSSGIDTRVDYVTLEQDLKKKERKECRESPVGLGYRVPLVIASPWSRGGAVCSQVFDHTSILQFMEKFLSHKLGKEVKETNISSWRRAVCGDLTAAFRPYNNEKFTLPPFIEPRPFYESVHKAQFLKNPHGYKALQRNEIAAATANLKRSALLIQEKGTKDACALPYELYADGNRDRNANKFLVKMKAGNTVFGANSAGSPFLVYAGRPHVSLADPSATDEMRVWNYAVKPGDVLTDVWDVDEFSGQRYHLKLHGPNGFYREFAGDKDDPSLDVICEYEYDVKRKQRLTGSIKLQLVNYGNERISLQLSDPTYNAVKKDVVVPAATTEPGWISLLIPTSKSGGWYDVKLVSRQYENFQKRFAGHVETGSISSTDPAMA
jgi:phospholipase C